MSLENKVCEHTPMHGTFHVRKNHITTAACNKCMDKIFKFEGSWYNKQEVNVVFALLGSAYGQVK